MKRHSLLVFLRILFGGRSHCASQSSTRSQLTVYSKSRQLAYCRLYFVCIPASINSIDSATGGFIRQVTLWPRDRHKQHVVYPGHVLLSSSCGIQMLEWLNPQVPQARFCLDAAVPI